MSLTWALIGASSWASEWMIDAMRATGGTVGPVLSTSAERGERFAADHALPGATTSLDALLADPSVDAVYVSTTNDLHAAQVRAAAAAGKHVLCEKPIATSLADARGMAAACAAAGVVLAVNHHVRCKGLVQALREQVAGGAIGEVLAARISDLGSLVAHRRTWRTGRAETGAGVVLDLTVHDVDTARFVLGDEIVAASAMAVTQGVAQAGIEDGVMGTLRTRGDVLVAFHDAFTIGGVETAVVVHGTQGTLEARDVFGAGPGGSLVLRRGDEVRESDVPHRRNPYEVVLERFGAAVGGGGAPAATGEDGIAALAVSLAVLESARTGRTVSPGS